MNKNKTFIDMPLFRLTDEIRIMRDGGRELVAVVHGDLGWARKAAVAEDMLTALEDLIAHRSDGATMRELNLYFLQIENLIRKATGGAK